MKYILTTLVLVLNFWHSNAQQNTAEIMPGAYQMDKYLPLLKDKRVAVLINQASVVNNKVLVDTLKDRGIKIVKIFVPEHGLRLTADAGATVASSIDSATGIPIVSLYGNNKKPTAKQLKDVDIVVYDLQDVGVRFYTYISTLQYAMEACAENDVPFLILDRPDPNGFYIDGPVMKKEYMSFVGLQPIPVVYAMTPGEYAKMLVGEKWFDHASKLDLTVIDCANYDHSKKYKLRYTPSPNLRSMPAIYMYPTLCLFEGTVVSVGRGSELPFQQWGHPDFYGHTAYNFTPKSGPGAKNPLHENRVCYGQLAALTTDEAFLVTKNKLRLNLLDKAYGWYPYKEKFFNDYFEKLAGNGELRNQIISGTKEDDIRATWKADIDNFKIIRKKYLIYKDFE